MAKDLVPVISTRLMLLQEHYFLLVNFSVALANGRQITWKAEICTYGHSLEVGTTNFQRRDAK